MGCNKMESRTIFDMFTEYSCTKCKHNLFIDEIKIGNDTIYIYYRGYCLLKYEKSIKLVRTKLLFKDIIIDSLNKDSSNIFLWLDIKDDLYNIYDDLELFMNNGYNIHIIK